MYVSYDSEADAMYVRLRPRIEVAETRELDAHRILDYDASGEVIGVKLLVSRGIDRAGVPEADRVAGAFCSFPRVAV